MPERFDIFDTAIAGLHVIRRKPIGDSRGALERLYCAQELQQFAHPIAQINRTYTARAGTVRGLHFQHPPHAELKFVSCLRGEVYDVAVDLRRSSPTFLEWHAEVLSADNYRTMVIPEGCAHGFQALTDDCELLYFHSTAYCAEAEAGLNALDPRLSIEWPLPVQGLSDRDRAHPVLNAEFGGIDV